MITPGYYSYYPSYLCSPYYCWFKNLGYPELDILEYQDGSWAIIQYLNTPHVPSESKWQVALGTMRNIEKTYAFCQKYVKQIDLEQKEFWAREEAKSKLAEDEFDAKEEHAQEYVGKAYEAITRNPDLMDRIAENGIQEMNLDSIAKHVPRSEFAK